MAIRVAMIGYGAVGPNHVAQLEKEPEVQLVSVYGPKGAGLFVCLDSWHPPRVQQHCGGGVRCGRIDYLLTPERKKGRHLLS